MKLQDAFDIIENDWANARASHAYRAEAASIQFTESLYIRMQDLGITRSQLAEKIGVKPAYITKILRGDTNFTLETMVKLAHALDCELSCVLKPKPAAKAPRPTPKKAKPAPLRRPKAAPALAAS